MLVPELSPTEERIVLLLAEGRTASEIAAGVGLDERTVEWHLVQAARKLETATSLRKQVLRAVGTARGAEEEQPQ
ncbi:MAG TPA: LuxR C-terminal-related transcriptional regulator [Candidatus Limnocylindria bacterium]|nr:LuxR C-terminal-related transcriptional regulator [Candidatus Limnocylindria bacterium]